MDVVLVNSSMPVKVGGPRAYKRALEGIKFLAGEAFTPWILPLMCCLVICQIFPFYLIVCNQSVGIALGVWMYYKKRPDGYSPAFP